MLTDTAVVKECGKWQNMGRIKALLFFVLLGGIWAQENDKFNVLHNMIDPGKFGQVGGAVLQDPGSDDDLPEMLESFTVCLRFQLKILGSKQFSDRGMVVNIGDW